MYTWAHSHPVVTQAEALPGKLPSLDWLLKAETSNTDEQNENMQRKGAVTLLSVVCCFSDASELVTLT